VAKRKMAKGDSSPADESGWTDPRELGVSNRVFFKPEDGKTKRVHLMIPGNPETALVQFVQGLGYIHTFCTTEKLPRGLRINSDGLDFELLGKEPVRLYMAPVLVYDTDKHGQIAGKKTDGVGYEFQLWSFYQRDYDRLRAMSIEWGEEFANKDLLITGKKSGAYLNADIAIASKSAVCLQKGLIDQVEAEFAGYQFRDASRWIARTVTEAELREAIDKAPPPQKKGSARSTTNG